MGSSGSHSAAVQVLPSSLDEHLRRMPDAYGERYTVKQLNRHLQLLAGISPQAPVAVDVQSLGPQLFDATVVGLDRPGVLAAITSAVAVEGLNVVDLQLATYEDNPDGRPAAFVDVVRLSSSASGLAPRDLADRLRTRLESAFAELSQGDVGSALLAASDSTRTNSVASNRVWTPVAKRNDDLSGVTLNDEFVLQKLIGTGGMSDVYLAEQIKMGRAVAIKLLKRQSDTASDSDTRARFARESAVVTRFDCPQIVAVFGSGVWNHASGPRPWMALEYMPGGDLASLIRRQGVPPEDIGCNWFRQALEGLAYAHGQGVLHRDLKPHNLLLDFAGELKLNDFGLLKQQFLPNDGRTVAGQIFGTPRYMSPEQALGEALDERSDIYSLGATFFEVFAGKSAFDHQNPTALLLKISSEDAPSLSDVRPHISRPMAVIISRMMARNRDERYQDVGVVLADLASYIHRGLLGRSKGSPQAPSIVERTLMANDFL